MPASRNPIWAELVQLVPVVSLALPFILAGKVDLSRAGSGLVAGALLTLPVTALVLWKRAVLNPILIGTGLWLWTGAVAFALPLTALWDLLVRAQGFGLFVGVLVAGVSTLLFSPHGYIGARHDDPAWLRRKSLQLLAVTGAVLVWSWVFRHDIRLGGGLPFIVLNVTRRRMLRA